MAYNPRWNIFSRIIDGDTRIAVIDGGTSQALVEIDGGQVADFRAAGLQMATGARVNEFSTDGTLAGASDTALPTEAAVKTYVDTEISNIDRTQIFTDDSYVKVVDDGTAPGYVEIVTDGVQVGYFDAQASTQRIGKASGAGRVDVTDTQVGVTIATTELFAISSNIQRLGTYTDTYAQVNQSSNYFNVYTNSQQVFIASASVQRLGVNTGTSISTIPGTHTIEFEANNVEIFNATSNAIKLGVDGDTSIDLDQSTDTVSITVGGAEVVNATPDLQQFGGPDTYITMDQTSGVAVLGENTVEAMTLDENGLQMFGAGATINEFSNDSTLADASATSLPTEYAVKTYVDAQISGQADIIFADDSYVKVVDDGTATGYVEIVTDGVQVAYFDALASTQVIGKGSGYGRLRVGDTFAGIYSSNSNYVSATTTGILATAAFSSGGSMSLQANTSSFGKGGSEQLYFGHGSSLVQMTAGGQGVFELYPTIQRLGTSTDSRIVISQALDSVDIYAGSTQVADLTNTAQTLGVSGDTRIVLSQSADTFDVYAANTKMIGVTTTSIELGASGDTSITLNQSTDQVTITAGGQSQIMVETSGTTVYDDLTVTGDLFVDGTTWVVHNQEVTTSDNLIVINNGEVGPGVTAGFAGLEVDRGTLTDYRFIFAESTDTFRVGEIGNLQAVATREDSPVSMTVPWWNPTEYRFDTAGNASIVVTNDSTGGIYLLTFNADGEEATISSDGLQLASGARVNEFSTDGTLAGDSNTVVPTEAAVKTYVDAQILGSADMIWADDSYVKVVDDGTATGYVEIVTDGVQVAYFDPEASTQRIGKASGAGRVTVTDTTVTSSIGASDVLSLAATSQTLGIAGDTRFTLNQSTDEFEMYLATTKVASGTATGQTWGVQSDARVVTLQSSGLVRIHTGTTQRALFSDTEVYVGGASGTRLTMNPTTHTLDMYVSTSQIFAATTTAQTFGIATDTNIALNQTANTIVFEAANVVEATINTNGLSLKTGASVNEFSTDGTFAGDSDDAVPTEKAAKLYVDTSIANIDRTQIFADDSYVKVVDDGTATGYVEIVTDGVQVGYFDAEATSIRLGKASGASRITIADETLSFIAGVPGTLDVMSLSGSSQRFGTSGDTNITMVNGSNSMTFNLGNIGYAYFDETYMRVGQNFQTSLQLDLSGGTADIYAGTVQIFDGAATSQTLGVSGDSRIELDQTADTAKLYAGASLVVEADPYVQTFGIADEIFVTIDQTASTIVISENQVGVALFTEEGFKLESGATVNEFSTDGTLAGDSDTAVPTEKAVKLYVDTAIAGLAPDTIWADDSYVKVVDDGTATGYVEIVTDGVQVSYWDASGSSVRIGKADDSRLVLENGYTYLYNAAGTTTYAEFSDGEANFNLDASGDGLALRTYEIVLTVDSGNQSVYLEDDGFHINASDGMTGISSDVNLGTSNSTLVTQGAVKAYVDAQIGNVQNIQYVYSDTTAVNGDILLVDTTAGEVNIEMIESNESRVIIKKVTTDGNNVVITASSGLIDGAASKTIDTAYQSYHFVSDGINYFIL